MPYDDEYTSLKPNGYTECCNAETSYHDYTECCKVCWRKVLR